MRGESGQRQGHILLVWVSAFVFHFHSKHLHAWKINQWHLRHRSRVNASGSICHLPVTQTGLYTLCGRLMITTVNDMNRSPTSQNQNNHQLFLSIINRTIRMCWWSCWAEFLELWTTARSAQKIRRETLAWLWTPFKAATLDTAKVGTAEGLVRKTWECTVSSITLSNPAHHHQREKNQSRSLSVELRCGSCSHMPAESPLFWQECLCWWLFPLHCTKDKPCF